MAQAISNILAIAQSQLGVYEFPAGSNNVRYNTAYYGRNVKDTATAKYPWCCVFIWWLFVQTGYSKLFYGGGKTASCGTLASYGKKNGLYITGGYRSGDLAFMNFSGKNTPVHIGIVESVAAGEIITIEGNTGSGNDANGGQVQRRHRELKYVVGGYRPQYEEDSEMAVKTQVVQQTIYEYLTDIPTGFKKEITALMNAGVLKGDGSDPDGNGDRINLTHDQVRSFVIEYRGGAFDRALLAAGLTPVFA